MVLTAARDLYTLYITRLDNFINFWLKTTHRYLYIKEAEPKILRLVKFV